MIPKEKLPCSKCGSTNLSLRFDDDDDKQGPSQYMVISCKCGNKGRPSWFFKNCGMDDMDDEEIAIDNWNYDNKPKQGLSCV